MTVDSAIYWNDKDRFFKKHKHDFQTDTSSMNEYGVYYKTYCFADGAIWYERMAPVWRTAEAEVEVAPGVTVKITQDVKLFETEYWNTEAGSKKYYEKF